MKIEMIDIQEDNDSLATTIALLVDRQDFLQDIQQLRNQLEINTLLNSAQSSELLHFAEKVGHKEPEMFLENMNQEVANLRRKYGRTINHDPMIKWALFTNTVPKGLFRHAYYELVQLDKNDDPQYVLVLDPRATDDEVKQASNELREYLFGYSSKQINRLINQGVADEFLPIVSVNKYDFEAGLLAQDDAETVGQKMSQGPLYAASNKELVTIQKNLNFNRNMYWLRYKNQINDPTASPLTNQEVLDEWKQCCPTKGLHQNGDEYECDYCSITELGTIQDAIEQHQSILSKDF